MTSSKVFFFVVFLFVFFSVSLCPVSSSSGRKLGKRPSSLPNPPTILASLSKVGKAGGGLVVTLINKHSRPVALYAYNTPLSPQCGEHLEVRFGEKKKHATFVGEQCPFKVPREKDYVVLPVNTRIKRRIHLSQEYSNHKGSSSCNKRLTFRARLRTIMFSDYRICTNVHARTIGECASKRKVQSRKNGGKTYIMQALVAKVTRKTKWVHGRVRPCPKRDEAHSQEGKVVVLSGNQGRAKKSKSDEVSRQKQAKDFLNDPRTKKKMGVKTSNKKADTKELEEITADKRRSSGDEKNKKQAHTFIQTKIDGKRVYGGDLAVHVDKRSDRVYHVSGRRLTLADVKKSGEGIRAKISWKEATTITMESIRKLYAKRTVVRGDKEKQKKRIPQLCYVFDDEDVGRLAFRFLVKYYSRKSGIPQLAWAYASAVDGRLIAEHPVNQAALSRNSYDAQYSSYNIWTRDTNTKELVRGEGSPSIGDPNVDKCHGNTKRVYDYFSKVHGRDSYDNHGHTVHSTCHMGKGRAGNAFWNGKGLYYGDDLGQDVALVAHEFTHGVIAHSARLVYSGESGALNEATADIFGYSTRIFHQIGSKDWTLGHGSHKRYMANPTQDGVSKDYYPERYQGLRDNGGVHWNSGIANLFFRLLSEGGKHPRGKGPSWLSVDGIGMEAAANIWYRALTVYFTSGTGFAEARAHTIKAAMDLYKANSLEVNSVKDAWGSVGVGASLKKKPPRPRASYFPASSYVEDVQGNKIPMHEVKVGQKIKTFSLAQNKVIVDTVTKIHMHEENREATYLSLKVSSSDGVMVNETVSACIGGQYLLLNPEFDSEFDSSEGPQWKVVSAESLRVGDVIQGANGVPMTVEEIQGENQRGIFALETESGNLAVDGLATHTLVHVPGPGEPQTMATWVIVLIVIVIIIFVFVLGPIVFL